MFRRKSEKKLFNKVKLFGMPPRGCVLAQGWWGKRSDFYLGAVIIMCTGAGLDIRVFFTFELSNVSNKLLKQSFDLEKCLLLNCRTGEATFWPNFQALESSWWICWKKQKSKNLFSRISGHPVISMRWLWPWIPAASKNQQCSMYLFKWILFVFLFVRSDS